MLTPRSPRRMPGPWPLGLLALVVLAGCGPSEPPPNILLVTLDTTRPDRLGCYGYAGAATPAIDDLAAAGVRFDHAYAQAPLTLASHASLLTGMHPRSTGLRVNADGKLGPELGTLAEHLKSRGYRTGAFVSAFVLESSFGLDRGFDVYDDDLKRRTGSAHFDLERPADQVTDATLRWLGQESTAPFFAWVHYYDPHAPYDPPQEYKGRFADAYDGEIAFMDAQLGRLVAWLDKNGARERTLVVVAGDHGEALLQHGEPEHGLFVYDATVRVPLILSWPGRLGEGIVRSEEVQLADVYPTLRALIGSKAARGLAGTSFAAELAADAAPAERPPVYGESQYGRLGYGWSDLRYVVHGGLKYIEAPRPELYDLRTDPGESTNVLEERRDDAAALRGRLLEIERRFAERAREAVAMDPDSEARLRSLGYVGSGGSAGGPGRDPKDMLDVYVGHVRAWSVLRRGGFEEARQQLEQLLARSPESLGLYEDLGWALIGTGRYEDAQAAYEKSLTALPDDPERLWGLGESLRRQGKFREAVSQFERAVERWPNLGEAHMGLALCLHALGDDLQAYEHARRHVEINPDSLIALNNLANLCLGLKRYDEALEYSGRGILRSVKSADAHYVRWEALRGAGRTQEAIQALRESREALPNDWLLVCALSWMVAVTPGGDPGAGEEAVRLGKICERMNPQHPRSFDTLAAAYAAAGAFDKAAATARKALALLPGPRAAQFRAPIERRLRLYEAGQPFREQPVAPAAQVSAPLTDTGSR